MFNSERIEALEKQVAELKEACTMRVGEYYEYAKPTVTAIQLLELLMAQQKVKPIVQRGSPSVEATPDKVVLSKPKRA